jgi:arylsulfatase
MPEKVKTMQKKPNILFIMADDIGWFNVSAYNHGLMGYRTPNIDRIAKEGAMFTDFYGQQSCTAGRAAFITGQSPIRTGLTKVGMPGATLGLSAEDPSVAQFMKNFGYATGQFGKNHLGDRNEHLPTVHGFDEFFGNLYHLNAEEEPEYPNYPKDPKFRKQFGPRGVLKCKATDKDDATVDDKFGKVGKQTIENTGPLTRKRMETVDEEFIGSALDFIDRKSKEGAPWFCYFNPTGMHVFTHLKPSSVGKTGLGLYPDGMVELDGYVGQLLKKLDDVGVADNTVVVFTTDNGAEVMSWPDGGATPFRGEKDTNWEGGWRIPCVMRWPGVIEPGRVINEICSLQDFIPTFAAASGEPDLVEKVKKGYPIAGKTFKVHLDGVNLLPFLSGKEEKSPREGFIYWSDDGDCMAIRVGRFKVVFAEQRNVGLDVWREPLSTLRVPKFFDLRADPFERGEESFKFNDWFMENIPLQYLAPPLLHKWLESFKEFPPRAKAASFTIDQVVQQNDESGSLIYPIAVLQSRGVILLPSSLPGEDGLFCWLAYPPLGFPTSSKSNYHHCLAH